MVLSYFPCTGPVGLYEYTVQTNNIIEGTNMVSIGFHYVAADTNGNPLDAYVDGTPDYLDDATGQLAAWEMSWFALSGLDLSTNLDVCGQTWLYDYENALDPNVINFTVRLGNQHFNTTNAAGTFVVLGGLPGYSPVLVNNTNTAGAVWSNYTVIMKTRRTPNVIALIRRFQITPERARWGG